MTVIPKWCFERCTALETIPMTKYIKTIEDGAFNDCNLKELVIPDNVESAVMPFSYQEYYYPDTNEAKRKKQIPEQDRVLERVYIGKNINNIIVSKIICPKFTAFEVSPENQTYTSINGILYTKDGKSIISIPSGIPEVIIPEGTESFADKAALSTTYTQKMSIPASFEDMDVEAFKKFPELTQLEISPDNPVYSTDGKAILSKDKTELIYVLPIIKDYTVPDYIKKLSENSCKTVERLIIPDGITEIPAGVIWYDTKMISIPNSVTKIDEAILKSFNDRIKSNQTVALDVYCDYDSPAMAIFKSIITVTRYYTDGKTHHQIWYKPRGSENCDLDFVFGDDGEIIVNGYHGSDTSVTIPGSLNGKQVVGIDSNTFSGNKNIVSVTIEDGVDWIGQNVFRNFSSLSSVRLPNTLTLIGFGAFAGCGSLRCLTIPKSLESIDGDRVFDGRNSRFYMRVYKDTYGEEYAKYHNMYYVIIDDNTPDPADTKSQYKANNGNKKLYKTDGKEDLVIEIIDPDNDDETFYKFDGVELDGETIDKNYYTTEKGSLILTLKKDYLTALGGGDHSLKVNFIDGAYETTIIKPIVETDSDIPTDTHSDSDRYDSDRYDTDRYDTDRYDTDRYDTDRYDTDRHDTDRYDTDRYDTDRYDTDRYDTDRYDTDRSSDIDSDTKPIGSEEKGVLGDLDGDEQITANDALTVLRKSIGLGTFTSKMFVLADVDGNGDITANDALAVLRFSIGLSSRGSIGKQITLKK